MTRFVNESKPKEPDGAARSLGSGIGKYGFDRPSPYLLQWGSFFQTLVSLAGTKLLTGKFTDRAGGIFKSEGGCLIDGAGDLVLMDSYCRFDGGPYLGKDSSHADTPKGRAVQAMADLITKLVLAFDPMRPIDSLLEAAAAVLDVTAAEVRTALEAGRGAGGPFAGDALSSFFRYNPFNTPANDRSYERYCRVTISGQTDAEVDQLFADEDLGEELFKKLRERAKDERYRPLCCSPRRMKDGQLSFWINTGCSTQIDGWRTQAEVEAFIASNDKLVDPRRG